MTTLDAPRTDPREAASAEGAGWGEAACRPVPGDWNRTVRPYPRDTPIHQLVLARAAARPDAPAIVDDRGSLTYGELAARSERLARALAARGVGLETRVGVAVERSQELVVALLAVLRAGGAYVPLDPANPRERLALLVADARAPLVVASAAAASRLPAGTPILRLDRAADAADSPAADSPLPAVPPDALAYVMYTSGSTGRPKGVAVTHRNVVRLVAGSDFARLGGDEVVLACAPAAFDASTLEVWGPLANGGRLALPPPGPLSLDDLGAAIARHGATTLWLTAGLFHQVVDERLSALAPPLAQLLAGGDVLSPRHVARVRAAFPARALTNAYGPTDNTPFTCCHRIDRADGPIPIGRPIANSTAHVLDHRLEPLAVGEAGELCAGGDGVARGYLDRPGLTAERFVPDPFGPAGSRLYRTGDLARWRADGTLDFLGRRDGQAKVRGFRVEPAEVEAVLGRAPGVAACAAAVRGTGDCKRLVAWVVGPAASDPRALRAWLADRLPEHLVPSAFVGMPLLPLTSNGKVDRRALPDPGAERPDLDTPYAPAEDQRQRRLLALWTEILGIDGIGVDDDLIALGGHSLAAARIAARVRESEGVDLPVFEVFARPTVRGLGARIGALAGGGNRLPPLVAGERPAAIPLSFQQEQVWFLQQLAPEMIAYNFQCSVRLAGRLDVPLLERALGEIVRRHEVLRTVFVEGAGGPQQRVAEPWRPRAARVDLSALPAARRAAAAEALVPALVRRRFDVGRLPLIGWTAVRLAENDHLLVQVEHHFLHDGWSISVFFRELAAVYAAFAAGEPSPLPEMPVQYADLALWQRRALRGPVLDEQLAYWRAKLADPPPALELPADRPRPPRQSFRGGCLDEELPPALYRQLRRLARSEGVTLFVTLLAAFQALLARVCGRRRFLLGSGIANRRLAASEGLIGMVVNTVALGADLDGDPTFRELLARVRGEVLAAQAHPDLPLERLVADLQPERDLSRNPLFQAMFSFHDSPVPDLAFAGITGALRERHNGSAKLDLNVVVRPRAEQRLGRAASDEDDVLRVLWEYSTDLFDRRTVAALWARYRSLLAAVVADPTLRLSRLPLLDAEERRRLAGWNATSRPYPRSAALHDLVLAAAARRGEAPAVVWDGGSLSYRELAARSEALARRLVARGVGVETRVGLALARSPEMIVATLAVLRAGGAYLPLDPESPAERLGQVLADGGAELVLVDGGSAAALPAGVPTLELAAALAGPPASGPLPEVPAEALAYVMSTSGSTGRPKAVAVSHRNVVRLVAAADYADLSQDEVFLQAAPTSFDAATLEIWAPLANGGRLALPPPGKTSIEDLAAAVERFGVTTLWLTAGLFHQMVDARLPALAGVRQLLAGGDVLSPAHVDRVLAELPATAVINGYGPTEGTTFTCCHRARPGESPVPIGRPIANTTAWLLGRHGEPVPAGTVGELHAGGDGVARGYLGQPARTAERFVPDPFGEPGSRLYRTGDLARQRPDGTLDFLGRRDGQVKLRGFRVEIGEVEAALAAAPGVAACAVAVRGEGEGKRLVAWVVPAGREDATPPALDPEALVAALGARLPAPMIPSRFHAVASLPLSPNGKLDRGALVEPERSSEDVEGGPPSSLVEELVAELWRELLELPRVGVRDHFFRLGGHSLTATRLVTRLREALGCQVPLALVFEHPVLADFAAVLEAELSGEEEEPASPAAAPPAAVLASAGTTWGAG